MNDMSATIIAKSDQINAADLIGSPRTVTIKEVRIKDDGGDDQPVSIMIEGDDKAFRPCKGVRRLLVRAWGLDAGKYIGQSMTLFCDPSVTWAGKDEGGVRVSHMSGLPEEIVEFMRINRKVTKPYTIKPLAAQSDTATAAKPKQTAVAWAAEQAGAAWACATADTLADLMDKGAPAMRKLETGHPALWADVNQAYAEARRALEHPTAAEEGDDFATEE